jgi:F0F1-type ATP synthase assembly protein I
VEKREGSMGSDYAKGMGQASDGLSTAFGFVIVMMVFWLGGRALDGWIGTEPWLQVVGAIVGWVLGTLSVVYSARYRKKS